MHSKGAEQSSLRMRFFVFLTVVLGALFPPAAMLWLSTALLGRGPVAEESSS